MTKENKKVIFITGSSSGIGFQLARIFADDANDNGYVIYATSHRVTPEMEQLAGEFVRVKKLDVTIDEDCDQVIDDIIATEGHIDVLVHCAGKNHFKAIDKVTVAEAKHIMSTNVTGLMNVTGKCLRHMKETGTSGHIIAVSAFSGILGIPFNSIYSASKFALEGYFESLREELHDTNIRLNIMEVGPVSSSHDIEALNNLECGSEQKNGGSDSGLIETFKQQVDASYQTMSQSPEEISLQVRTIIERPDDGQFRYETNELFANALSRVFKEKTNLKTRLSSIASTL